MSFRDWNPQTWLGWQNFLFWQWTGFRRLRGGGWLGPVMPLSGWWDEYRKLPGFKVHRA